MTVLRSICCAALALTLLRAAPALADEDLSDAQVQALVRTLRTGSIEQRTQAADELGARAFAHRAVAIQGLREALPRATDWQALASILRALGRLEARQALPDFVRALRHERPEVRMTAAAALWRVPDPVVVPALISALRDDDATVRQWAATALGSVQDRRAIQPLVDRLSDSVEAVRLEAIRSLRRIAAPEAVDALENHAMNDPVALDERREAVAAVMDIVDDDAEALLRMMESPDVRLRRVLAEGIGALADQSDTAAIRRLLRRERNWHVRRLLNAALRNAASRDPASQPPAPPAQPQAN